MRQQITSPTLEDLLQISAQFHHHICPRMVLGVRMGMAAGHWLGLALPQTDKRVLTIAETDGCGADGISAATGCWVGRRTLRIMDFGKMAATFVDMDNGNAVRITPSAESRLLAPSAAPDAKNHWEAYLLGYQRMTDEALLSIQPVHLDLSIEQLMSQAGIRTNCVQCGEEIINEREVVVDGEPWCKSCAGEQYYRPQKL
jgi:formylmethanofuran dehydrogenase subunit E